MFPVATLGFKDADTLRKVFAGTYRRYTYSTPVTLVAALNSIQATTAIESLNDFVCNTLTARAFYSAGAQINREVDFFVNQMPRIELQDQSSGASLFDRSDTIMRNCWGTAQDPFELEQPMVFRARTVITTIITNVDAAAGMLIQVAFHGFKVPAGRI